MGKEYTMITIKQFVLRSAIVFGFALIFSFFSFVDRALADCPEDAQEVCNGWFGEGKTTATGFCKNEECFEISYSEELRVVAADDQGSYPLTWFVWHSGMMVNFSCESLQDFGKKKTRIQIPEDLHCAAILVTSNHLYYELFVSDADCVGWLECMLNPLPVQGDMLPDEE